MGSLGRSFTLNSHTPGAAPPGAVRLPGGAVSAGSTWGGEGAGVRALDSRAYKASKLALLAFIWVLVLLGFRWLGVAFQGFTYSLHCSSVDWFKQI